MSSDEKVLIYCHNAIFQVYKQKGEEYRIHGQWGWLWLSSTRRVKIADSRDLGLSSGPYKYMVQVKGNFISNLKLFTGRSYVNEKLHFVDDKGFKILAVEEKMYEMLMNQCKSEEKNGETEADESEKKENSEFNAKQQNTYF